jgi:hypothetical protein
MKDIKLTLFQEIIVIIVLFLIIGCGLMFVLRFLGVDSMTSFINKN